MAVPFMPYEVQEFNGNEWVTIACFVKHVDARAFLKKRLHSMPNKWERMMTRTQEEPMHKLPNTDATDRQIQKLIEAGKEYAALCAIVDAQYRRSNDISRADLTNRLPKCKALLDLLMQQKEAAWSELSCHLAGLEDAMTEKG